MYCSLGRNSISMTMKPSMTHLDGFSDMRLDKTQGSCYLCESGMLCMLNQIQVANRMEDLGPSSRPLWCPALFESGQRYMDIIRGK